jgi:2-polyprenyl-3-methyl-5-hydroxy-6-metoxy-1,4-benzoquinol methylase
VQVTDLPSQDRFKEVYRGGQSPLRHMAYLRMSKVFILLEALRRQKIDLEGKRIFDYAFGAGTFFRYCPKSASLSGVEIDDVNVQEVRESLSSPGFPKLDLQPISLENWKEHPLLQQQHDVIICSHVLEHLEEPSDLLCALAGALAPDGIILAVLPINELRSNPHHLQVPDEKIIRGWVSASGLEVSAYFEADHIGWPVQPIIASDRGLSHLLARILSLALGVPLSIAGLDGWRGIDAVLRSLRMPASQACAVVRKNAECGREAAKMGDGS